MSLRKVVSQLNCFRMSLTGAGRKERHAEARSITYRYSRSDIQSLLKVESQALNLRHADLSGIDLSDLNLRGANFSHCTLRETNFARCFIQDADFSFAYCRNANFHRANLSRANFSHAYLRAADLSYTSLYRANLEDVDFREADLRQATLYRASLTNARIQKEAIGENIIPDGENDFKEHYEWFLRYYVNRMSDNNEPLKRRLRDRLAQAEHVYRTLKTTFANNGQYAEASWAYIRERQVRRQMHFPLNARLHFAHELPDRGHFMLLRRLLFYGRHCIFWLLDWMAEITCGYGEKPLRTIALALLVLLLFPILYTLAGGIVADNGPLTWLDYFNYSLAAFTTLGFDQFQAVTPLAQTLTSIEALLGIALLALLMFVLGNRISRT